MNPSEIAKEIGTMQSKLNAARDQRNEQIRRRYRELYNVNTFNKIKLGYVYATIGKEFGIKEVTVRGIIYKSSKIP